MLAAARSSLESAGTRAGDLSEGNIRDRVESASEALHRIVREYLGNKAKLHQLANEITTAGATGLRAVAAGDEGTLHRDPQALAHLEVIVRMDGSRPSFMVRHGDVDRTTSPVGTWGDALDASADQLRKAIACVGRIDDPASPQGFQGTGFLVADDLIVTNRHVLQAIATPIEGGWEIRPKITIDFGHEFRARASMNKRTLKEVVFAGKKPIANSIDHRKLDLALIRLAKAPASRRPATVLSVDVSGDWPASGAYVYTIGYPGSPEPGEYPFSALEQLFQSTFGCKRLAPGAVTSPLAAVGPWTVTHDSTTLGGNSGSVVLVVGRELAAAGLHYGGQRADPRENWGHVLGRVLGQSGRDTPDTLRKVLTSHGVVLVDRTIADG
jgi:V8-like Glu-specific endopeptidase